MKKIKVFLDSSVILAGLASTTGASAEMLCLAEIGIVELIICDLIVDEVKRNLTKKLPEFLPYFYSALEVLKPEIHKNKSTLDRKLVHLFPKESDQVIIQTALVAKPDYFVTLDKQHLLQPNVINEIQMKIVSPSEFLDKIRSDL